jgi:vacuolar-type H+-ATPase subunit E/Vma4
MDNPDDDELIAYLDGELDPPTNQKVEERLKHDPAYRQALTLHERSWDMLDRLQRSTVDENFTRSTLEMVSLAAAKEEQPLPASGRFDRRRLGIVALVAAAALMLGYAGGRTLWPDPNRELLQDLPVLEDLDLYEQAGSIDFLRKLADTGLFGDEAGQVKATPGLAVSEAPADRRAEIARMMSAEKEHLVRKLQRFDAYSTEQQQRLRQIYESLNHDADGRPLREVLIRYHEWLETLISNVREELDDLPEDGRIDRIHQLKHEQAERRKQEVKEAPTEQDLTAIIGWFEDFAWQNHQALLGTLPDRRRQYLEGLEEAPRRRASLWIWMAQHGGPGHLRLGQVHLTETDFDNLAELLSPGARARLDAAEELPEKRRLIFQWANTAVRHRFETGKLRRMLPAISVSELRRFADDELSSAQRAPLAKMLRDKKFRELQWLYFLSADRLKEMKPEDIATGGPGHGGGPSHRPPAGDAERRSK